MGEVRVEVEIENTGDRILASRGFMERNAVRCQKVRLVADRGAVMPMLPHDLVEALGLPIVGTAIVTYADERKEERPIAGPLTIRIDKRSTTGDCVVGPPSSEPLLGQIPLEAMDLLVDCQRGQLVPRPESPYLPTLKLK